MPYGILVKISQSNQPTDLVDIDSARLIYVLEAESVQGNVTIPQFSGAKGDFVPVKNSNKTNMPAI